MTKNKILSSPWRLDMALRAGVAAAAFACAVMFVGSSPGFPLDDAYIHLTFARNLSRGLGFCFNPTEFSLGFSSPLWVMLLSLFGYLGGDLVVWAGRLSITFFAVSCALVFDIVRISVAGFYSRDTPPNGAGQADRSLGSHALSGMWPKAFGVLAGMGMAASGNMLWLSGAGMEATLFLCLGLLSILLLRSDDMRPIPGGIVLGLLVLVRPTGMALWLIIALYGLATRSGRRNIFPALIICACMVTPWFIFSLVKTGYLLPPTRAGKLASDLFNTGFSPRGIKNYTIDHLRYLLITGKGIVWPMLFGIAASVARIFLPGSKGKKEVCNDSREQTKLSGIILSPASVIAIWAVIHFFMHALLFRSTHIITPYNYLRYQVMLIPGVIAFSTYALALLAWRLARVRFGRSKAGSKDQPEDALEALQGAPALNSITRRNSFFNVIVLLFIVAPPVVELAQIRSWRQLYVRNVDQLQREHREAANWAGLTLPEDARIACLDIGMLGYYSGRYVIDLGGLINPEILPRLRDHRTGPYLVEKRASHYFAVIRPDSERITGVKVDLDHLYSFRFVRVFDYPPYSQPIITHSLGIEIYEIVRYKK